MRVLLLNFKIEQEIHSGGQMIKENIVYLQRINFDCLLQNLRIHLDFCIFQIVWIGSVIKSKFLTDPGQVFFVYKDFEKFSTPRCYDIDFIL